MLGERRKKQRIAVDPQNKKWTLDESSFGHKMLSKMGWKDGQGLGKDSDGVVAPVPAFNKQSMIGLGANDDQDCATSIPASDTFEKILQSLKSTGEEVPSKKSGKRRKREKSSKKEPTSTAAPHPVLFAHRKKYICSKNVSSYSASQLREILGDNCS